MCAVAIDAEHAAIYSASEVDIAIGVGMVELASMRAPLWKIIYPMVERPVSGLASWHRKIRSGRSVVCGVGGIHCRQDWK